LAHFDGKTWMKDVSSVWYLSTCIHEATYQNETIPLIGLSDILKKHTLFQAFAPDEIVKYHTEIFLIFIKQISRILFLGPFKSSRMLNDGKGVSKKNYHVEQLNFQWTKLTL
jgi:hypothetical protein